MGKKYEEKDVKAMKAIAAGIKESKANRKVFSRLEYFLLGGFPFDEALSVLYYMREDKAITDSEYYLLTVYVNDQRHVSIFRNRESILATKYIFADKTLDDSEKEIIWQELLEAGIREKDIDDIIFSAAVRAYAIKKNYIKLPNKTVSKTKTLKK